MTKRKQASRSATSADKETGERIRALRQIAAISQQTLAEHLGVSFQQVQKYEKGMNAVRGTRLTKIAEVLGTTVAYLLGIDEKGNASPHNAEMMRFLGTHGAPDIARAFMALPPDRRRMVIDLTNALAA